MERTPEGYTAGVRPFAVDAACARSWTMLKRLDDLPHVRQGDAIGARLRAERQGNR